MEELNDLKSRRAVQRIDDCVDLLVVLCSCDRRDLSILTVRKLFDL
jgi:hypothetical protein